MSCAGNGYLSGNMLISYPFEDGQSIDWECRAGSSSGGEGPTCCSDDLTRAADVALQKCFVDACVSLEESCESPSIGAFEIYGDRLMFTLASGSSETRLSAEASSVAFPIISGKSDFGSYAIVVSSEGIRDLIAFCSENGIFPPSRGSSSSSSGRGRDSFMEICARCVSFRPSGLTSISVYDGKSDRSSGPHFVLKGDVSILPGNNMSFSDPDANGLTIEASPGAGLGRVPCSCVSDGSVSPALRSPDGHVRLFNDTCYDLEPGAEETVMVDGVARRSRKLVISSKCTACCTCEMYASIVNDRLAALHKTIVGARDRMKDLSASYESAVARFNRRIATPHRSDVSMTLTGIPVSSRLSPKMSGTGIRGRMCRCAFSAVVRNLSYRPLSMRILSISGSDVIVESSVSWQSEDGVQRTRNSSSISGIVGSTFVVPSGKSLVVTFVSARKEMVSSVSNVKYSGTISVIALHGSSSLGTFTKSIEV